MIHAYAYAPPYQQKLEQSIARIEAQTLTRTGNGACAGAGAYLRIDIPYGWQT